MLAGIIIVFFTMPYHKYPMPNFPITMSKFGNVTVFSMMLLFQFAYVMVFGKTLDWFDDPCILFGGLSILPLCSSIWRRRGVSTLFHHGGVPAQGHQLRYPALLPADVDSSAVFVNVFTNVSMKIDNWQNATLGNWVMVGYTMGLIFAVIARAENAHLEVDVLYGFLLKPSAPCVL